MKPEDRVINQPTMFNRPEQKKRIGSLKKNTVLDPLEEVETYFLKKMKKYKTENSYDVNAQELPKFKTLNYTEYGTNFLVCPLNLELRLRQIEHAWRDTDDVKILDYKEFFIKNINKQVANKYQNRSQEFEKYPDVDNLVILPGSNKLKEHICLNKLKKIAFDHEGDIYFKPHPVTTHAIIGELKDMFGESAILPREIDLYHFLPNVSKVYTTHMSESALYAAVLGKEIEPIEVYQTAHRGSFYHINRFLFENQVYEADTGEWVNKTFSSPKSGIFNPRIDSNWKNKLDQYLSYIHDERERFSDWYVEGKPGGVKKGVDGRLIKDK